MIFRVRKLISFISLIAFLFPVATEAAHNLMHGHDFHCNEKSEKHFHVAEHHCQICDFVPSIAEGNLIQSQLSFEAIVVASSIDFYNNLVCTVSDFNFSLRAPPYTF